MSRACSRVTPDGALMAPSDVLPVHLTDVPQTPQLQIPTPQALIRQAQQLSSQCAPFEQTHQEQAADARRTTSVWVGNVCATQQASNVATMLCVAKVVGGRAAKLCSIHSHTLKHAAWLSMPCSRRRAACVAARTQSVPMSHLPEMQCEASHVLR